MTSNPPPHQQVLTAQDLAQFESLGVDEQQTSSPAAPATQQPPLRNPYNPFLAPQTTQHPVQDDLAQLNSAPGASNQPPAQQSPFDTSIQQPQPFVAAEQPQTQIPAGAAPAAAPLSDPPLASGLNAAAAAPRSSAPAPAASHSSPEPKAWSTKDVLFRGQERKIIMQNENGPCSLLAIANVLLLRGDIALQPPDRPLVSYDYLSSLIAEYLLTQPSTQAGGSSGNASAGSGAALERALSLLPQTRHGLNLNPSFLSNDTFHTSDGSPSLELFELLGIKLYHGFMPDSSAPSTYELLTRAGSYDGAVDAVVQGDTLAARFFSEGLGETGRGLGLSELNKRGGYGIVESTSWGTPTDRKSLSDALEISTFLDANGSQLTYPGLFALSSLPEGTLATLFRFNHLSVLYRPSQRDLPTDGASSRSPPAILTLMTDEVFIDEELAVWETLADVDGSGSGEVYDGRLRPRRIEPRAPQTSNLLSESGQPAGNEDADYALALQLHSEERDRAERRQQRDAYRRGGPGGRGHAPGSSIDPTSEWRGNDRQRRDQQQQQQQQRRQSTGGNLFSALRGNKNKRQAPNVAFASTPEEQAAAQRGAADDLAVGGGGGEGSGGRGGGAKKKDCIIM